MSDQDRSSVTVRIAGEEHTLRSNAPPEYTRRCAKLVSDRIEEIRSRATLLEPHRAAILAALSIADEYFRALETAETDSKDATSAIEALTSRIEEALA